MKKDWGQVKISIHRLEERWETGTSKTNDAIQQNRKENVMHFKNYSLNTQICNTYVYIIHMCIHMQDFFY